MNIDKPHYCSVIIKKKEIEQKKKKSVPLLVGLLTIDKIKNAEAATGTVITMKQEP